MPYPENLIKAMREDLTRFGVEETRTPEDLDNIVHNTKGAVMIVVNSVCGCAAGIARPAIGLALQHRVRPDKVVTVFVGADIAATERARGYFKGYFPSSLQSGSFKTARSCTCWNVIKSKDETPRRSPKTSPARLTGFVPLSRRAS